MELTYKQTEALDLLEDKTTKQLVFGGGAGSAKSFLGVYWIIKESLKYPGTRSLIGRSKLKTLKETTLKSFFEVCKLQGLENGKHFNYNAQTNVITFFNDSEIMLKDLFLYPADPEFDELGSLELTRAFVDECNQITFKAWSTVISRIRYKLDENNLVPKILGTCNPSKNWVYTEFYKKNKDNTLGENKKFIQALLSDNPFISKHYIDNWEEQSNSMRERLLFGNWEYDDDPDKIFDFDKISNCFTNSFINTGEKYLTADIAMQGSDKFVVIIWNGFIVEKIKAFDKTNGKEVLTIIENLAKEYSVPNGNITFDNDGVGSFLGGFLENSKPFINNSKALENENYRNLKTQCYFKLAEKIKQDLIWIKDEEYKEEIIKELEQIKQKDRDKDTKISLEGKDKVKLRLGRSPDFADALMMRMIFEYKLNKISNEFVNFKF